VYWGHQFLRQQPPVGDLVSGFPKKILAWFAGVADPIPPIEFKFASPLAYLFTNLGQGGKSHWNKKEAFRIRRIKKKILNSNIKWNTYIGRPEQACALNSFQSICIGCQTNRYQMHDNPQNGDHVSNHDTIYNHRAACPQHRYLLRGGGPGTHMGAPPDRSLGCPCPHRRREGVRAFLLRWQTGRWLEHRGMADPSALRDALVVGRGRRGTPRWPARRRRLGPRTGAGAGGGASERPLEKRCGGGGG